MPGTPSTPIPVVGELFNSDLFYTGPWTQQGGPGGIVDPQQTIGQKNGQYLWGCSHSINSAEYVFCQDASGAPKAAVRCPQCGWVATIEVDPNNRPPYYVG